MKHIIDGNSQEYNLSMSAFAKLCNTTRDTLRHYYEIELLLPRIDPTNGYHYYSASQITSFYFITLFRNMGCSLKEIFNIMNFDSKSQFLETCHEKINLMELQLQQLQQKINVIKNSLWILEKYDTFEHHEPMIDTLPELSIFKTKTTSKETSHHASDIAQDIQQHLQNSEQINNMPSFPIGTTIELSDVVCQNYVYSSIFSLSREACEGEHTFSLPSTRVISCYHDHTCDSIEDTYQALLAFAQKKRLTICSDLHIISLINIYDLNKNHTYFKYLFFCIE